MAQRGCYIKTWRWQHNTQHGERDPASAGSCQSWPHHVGCCPQVFASAKIPDVLNMHIAHTWPFFRLSTVVGCHQILVLEAGKVCAVAGNIDKADLHSGCWERESSRAGGAWREVRRDVEDTECGRWGPRRGRGQRVNNTWYYQVDSDQHRWISLECSTNLHWLCLIVRPIM